MTHTNNPLYLYETHGPRRLNNDGLTSFQAQDQNFKNCMRFAEDWVDPSPGYYDRNQTVRHRGVVWTCVVAQTQAEPGTNSDWFWHSERAMKWKGAWDGTPTTWKQFDVTIRDGLLVVANKDTSADPDSAHDDWDFMAWLPNQAILRGTPTNNAPGASYTAITGWPTAGQFGIFDTAPPNPVTGEITCPVASVVTISATIVLQQGNSNKELAYLFWIRGSTLGDSVWGIFDVATDKTTYRAVSGTFTLAVPAGEVLQLGYSWQGDSSPGTSTFFPSSFEVKMSLPVDLQA